MMRFPSRALALMASVLLLAVSNVAASDKKTPFPRRDPIVEAVAKTRAGVVAIKIARANTKDTIGSGVIVDERGFIITNRHVVGAAKTVQVHLADGSVVVGEVAVLEKSLDLAIVRIRTSKKLQALDLAPVTDLMVGEKVIAVGHPYGYTNTVSQGIISALGREIELPTGDVLTGLIQTDASINPGNSGGPLLNINGEVIGVNVALRDGAQGISFAINAGTVKQVLTKHLSAQRVAGVQHGLSCKEKILAEVGDDRQRVVVASCGPDMDSDVQKGDEILTVGQRGVANAFDLERALWDKQVGQQVEMKVMRAGKELTVSITLQAGREGASSAVALQPRPATGQPSANIASGLDRQQK